MAEWVIVVDDDSSNLQVASYILNQSGMRVTAIKSGFALLDYVRMNEAPDLILLDVLMPDMDGFETLEKLRVISGMEDVPVVFLSADEHKETETIGLSAGANDFIHKPFDPEILVRRVKNIIEQNERLREFSVRSKIDDLTGLLNKAEVLDELRRACATDKGALMVLDLDGFKLVNDLYGHDVGDRVLISFSEILGKHINRNDIAGRIGGDEFILFCHMFDSISINDMTEMINEELLASAREIMGKDMKIPLGVSVGAVFVSDGARSYEELFKLADRALYHVKSNGKHGCAIADELNGMEKTSSGPGDMASLSMSLEERETSSRAMWIGEDAFREVYQFMVRYIKSYHGVAYKVLFTLNPKGDLSPDSDEVYDISLKFGELLQRTLRKSDIMMQSGRHQFFLLLPELEEKYAQNVMDRILRVWSEKSESSKVDIIYEMEFIEHREDENDRRAGDK